MILTQGEKMVWAAALVKTNSIADAGKAVRTIRDLERLATEELRVEDDDEDLMMLRAMLGDEG